MSGVARLAGLFLLLLFLLAAVVVLVINMQKNPISLQVHAPSSGLSYEQKQYQQATRELAAVGVSIHAIQSADDIPASLITKGWTEEVKNFRAPSGMTAVVLDDFSFDRFKTIAMLRLLGITVVGSYTSCEQFLQVQQFAHIYVVDNIMEGNMMFADCVPHIYAINPAAFVFASSNEDPNRGFGGKTLVQEAIDAGFKPSQVAGAVKDVWLDGLAKVIVRVLSGG